MLGKVRCNIKKIRFFLKIVFTFRFPELPLLSYFSAARQPDEEFKYILFWNTFFDDATFEFE